MALFIPADESLPTREVVPQNGTDFKLKELYQLLSCQMIEVVPLPDKAYIMIVDEEGALTIALISAAYLSYEKPRNERATRLVAFPSPKEFVAQMLRLREAGVNVIYVGEPITDRSTEVDHISGDVLICKDEELR